MNVIQLTETSIQVTWDSPGSPVTGYRIFFEPDVGAIEVTGGDTESYTREGLQSGVEYSISIVALSPHLPSTVVGPITPSGGLPVPVCLCHSVISLLTCSTQPS